MAETLQEYKQRIARSGGFGRAEKMTAKQRKESARRAAQARWSKVKKEKGCMERSTVLLSWPNDAVSSFDQPNCLSARDARCEFGITLGLRNCPTA